MTLVNVCNKSNLKPGEGKVIAANGKTLAVFTVNNQVFAIDNTCLHRQGPLGEGELDGTTVTCPLHGWQYDVTTGKNTMPGAGSVKSYKVELKGDGVFVDV